MRIGTKVGVPLFLAAALVVLPVLSYPLWLPLPAAFLLVRDDLRHADCIVVLRGEDYFRIRKAVELFRQGFANHIVVSPFSEEAVASWYDLVSKITGMEKLSEKERLWKYFEYFGKDAENIELTRFKINSTFDEAFATKQLMLERGYRSMILVTNGYHMRRALIIFKLIFRDTGIQIYPVTAETAPELHDPLHWWRKAGHARQLISEYVSLFYNLRNYFFVKKGSIAFH